jgi:ATP-dependent DNA helicase RecG
MLKDINIILSEGESYKTEFKESADKSLASEVCAFANASGGRIFIGIDDNGNIVGTDTSNIARSRIQDTINQVEPRLTVDIAVYKNIIVITIPEGINKPYSCSKGFYLRSGPNSQKLERDSIIDFLQTEGKVIYDSIINEKYPITDNFNEAEYIKYLKKSGISDVLPREAVLKNLGCTEIANNGNLSYTNAGILFFRNNSHEVYFDFTQVVCALYKGTEKVDIIDAKDLNGSIIENIDNAMVFLKRNLRVRYEIKTVQRKNILELPEDALREAVTNAVCHRNYFEKGARIMVEIFDDRVEITNPGSVPKGITKDNFGKTSVTRNPVIASLLHRARYIERMGTGIRRINLAMEEAGLKKPVFQIDDYFFKVIFERGLSYHDKNDGTDGTVNGTDGTVNKNKILRAISEMPKITYDQLSEQLNIPRRTISREMKILREQGIINRIGTTKNGYWEIIK